MKNKKWFFISLIQLIFIVILISILINYFSINNVTETDLMEYIDQFDINNNYIPDNGYIPDAKTAKQVASPIIDNLTGCGNFNLTGYTIKYDKENRLWYVQKEYLLNSGGFIIIEQDSGRVIKALLNK